MMTNSQNPNFVHLHLHTHYSLLDGLGKPEDYLTHAKKLGMPAVAITDHGVAYGLIDFYQKAQKIGVQPILGCEAYVARHGRHQKRANIDTKPWHLILLARNLTGYQNLLKLVSLAHLEGFYYKPRIDSELLEQFGEGLIGLSACLQGEIASRALSDNLAEATEAIQQYQKFFGAENFYLELQHHPHIPEQALANEKLIALGQKLSVPIVATNDCHYVASQDAEAHDVLICVQTGARLADENRMRMLPEDFSLRSPAEMARDFAATPEACTNTLAIAKKCQVELPLGKRLIPNYVTPFNLPPQQYLTALVSDGARKRFGLTLEGATESPDGQEKVVTVGSFVQQQHQTQLSAAEKQKIQERLNYEIEVINKMGFASYFLIVWDFVKFAKEAGIAVGPGRGSAAGSLVSYCLGITDLNPLPYDLLFERFLNPERISMPDIDIDFADTRRDEVLDYVAEKYGRESVARISTFSTLAAKAAVKDVGRVFGISFAEMNSFTKLILSKPGVTLAQAQKIEPALAEAIQKEPFKKIWEIALKLEGVIRQAGVHACAVVISDKKLTEYTPLQTAPGDSQEIITQFSMHPIEDIGLLKMDFLGLRNLTIIQNCLEILRQSQKKELAISAIPLDDQKTFELFARAETTGIFQFESSGMRRYLKDLKPNCLEDLIAMVSLFRPGPMENIPQFIASKHEPKRIRYPHPILEKFLKTTYGVAVYQEQIQQIAQEFAGFSLGEGYLLIKAIAKKIPALLAEQHQKFIAGALQKKHTKQEAEKLFELIEPFAGYGFNKSHAACYALIAYQTGYLKSHFPLEFMAALLTADQDNLDRLALDIEECRQNQIPVLPPSVQESLADFTVVGRKIRFGLKAIKGIGAGPIQAILQARATQPFTDLADFVSRVGVAVINKRTLEALAFSGALDKLGERAKIAASFKTLADFAKSIQDQQASCQTSLFGEVEALPSVFQLAEVKPATRLQKLKWEKELLGVYVSAHPLTGLKEILRQKIELVQNLKQKEVGKIKTVGGLITNIHKIVTKKTQQQMAFVTLEDPTGTIEVSFFPKINALYKELITLDEFITVTGRLEFRNDHFNLSAQEVTKVDLEKLRKRAQQEGLLGTEVPTKLTAQQSPEQGAKNPELGKQPQPNLGAKIQINLPSSTDPAVLPKLKELLISAKSEHGTPAEILIPLDAQKNQRIKVPFKVGLGTNLVQEICGLAEGIGIA